MSKDSCFICQKDAVPLGDWDLDSLRLLFENFKLCKTHKEYSEARLSELSKQPTVTKEFLPPIIEQPKHHTEREVGEEG